METIWQCPVCSAALLEKDAVYCCKNKHSFDKAKAGYLNLLLSNHKNAAVPGDSKEMVQARTAFLEKGFYLPFAEKIAQLASVAHGIVIDAGCGEGYYTNQIGAKEDISVYGFDLSKTAVTHAAKVAKNEHKSNVLYGVASLFALPVQDQCANTVVNLFAPCAEKEFHRILRSDGRLLLGVAGENHLYGLKQAIYANPYKNEVRRDTLEGFHLIDVQTVEYEITLHSTADMIHLFSMTPYYWKTSENDRNKLYQLEHLCTQVALDILVYQKGE